MKKSNKIASNCYITYQVQHCTAFSLFFLHVVSDFTSIVDFPVTFAPDESEKRVTIQTSADNVLEGTEQFSAVLSSPPDRVTITQDTADISILDTGSGKHV